jgi:hypothetical protein
MARNCGDESRKMQSDTDFYTTDLMGFEHEHEATRMEEFGREREPEPEPWDNQNLLPILDFIYLGVLYTLSVLTTN